MFTHLGKWANYSIYSIYLKSANVYKGLIFDIKSA